PVEGSLQQVDDYMINYMSALCKTLQSIRSQVKEALPKQYFLTWAPCKYV
ncbi:hypothetical protein NFI96_007863, partial [Prochilodus magdalenae]